MTARNPLCCLTMGTVEVESSLVTPMVRHTSHGRSVAIKMVIRLIRQRQAKPIAADFQFNRFSHRVSRPANPFPASIRIFMKNLRWISIRASETDVHRKIKWHGKIKPPIGCRSSVDRNGGFRFNKTEKRVVDPDSDSSAGFVSTATSCTGSHRQTTGAHSCT